MSDRREEIVRITEEGRDKGKTFIITEMPASQGEAWGIRALLALARSGVEIPDDIAQAGIAGVASLGIKAFAGVNSVEALALLDEMFQCVQIQPDPANANVVRKLVENDIQEIKTRLMLRGMVFLLHTGFSMDDIRSKLKKAMSSQDSPNTKTSPGT